MLMTIITNDVFLQWIWHAFIVVALIMILQYLLTWANAAAKRYKNSKREKDTDENGVERPDDIYDDDAVDYEPFEPPYHDL